MITGPGGGRGMVDVGGAVIRATRDGAINHDDNGNDGVCGWLKQRRAGWEGGGKSVVKRGGFRVCWARRRRQEWAR